MNRADETIRRQLDELPAPDFPLTPEQQQQILAMACRKAGVTPRAAGPAAPAAAEKPRRRVLRTVLIAAAIACVGTATVFAAPALLRMLQGELPFFQSARTQSQVSDPLEAPRGSYDGARQQLEAYNAQVGQTVESAGISVTLDNVAMDVSGMDAFFTIRGEDAIRAVMDADGYEPDWDKLQTGTDGFDAVSLNGDTGILQHSYGQTDFYLDEDGALKMWSHYILNAVPQGDELELTLASRWQLGVEGDWSFTVMLDGASVRAGGLTAQPGVYDVGQSVTVDPTQEAGGQPAQVSGETEPVTVEQPLDLRYLAFGPVGGCLVADIPNETLFNGQISVDAGLSPYAFQITDDTGKILYPTSVAWWQNGESRFNLTAPDTAATSITLTPVVPDGEASAPQAEATVTVEEMKNGARLETSSLGGYMVQNFAIQDHAITFDLVPYGWPGGQLTIEPDDEGLVSMAEDEAVLFNEGEPDQTVTAWHTGLMSESIDGTTGVRTYRLDYYAATREELEQIPSFHYFCWNGYRLDTAHAVTLPLQPVE